MLNTYPKISVVTVSYNQGEFIERTILSVLNQNYPNLEYIIIDGGSTDLSVNIIKKYEAQLGYWVSEKDNGQYDAINKGFEHASGDIFCFLNADDIFLPWTLKTVASIFQSHQHVDWITSLAVAQMNADGIMMAAGTMNPISVKAFSDGLYIPSKPSIGVICQEGTFWRRSLWIKAGGKINLNRKLAGDFDLWCNFMRYAPPYCIVMPLAVMTRHKDQRSNQMHIYREECIQSLAESRQFLNTDSNFKSACRVFIWKKTRNYRMAWKFVKFLLSYKCNILNPGFDSNTFTLKWIETQMLVYKK